MITKKRWGVTLIELMMVMAVMGALIGAILITLNIFTGLQSTDTITRVKKELTETSREISRSIRNARWIVYTPGTPTKIILYQYPTDIYSLKSADLSYKIFDDQANVTHPSPSPSTIHNNWGKKTWSLEYDAATGEDYLKEETEWYYLSPPKRDLLVTTKSHLKGFIVPPDTSNDEYIFKKTASSRVFLTWIKVKAFGRTFELKTTDFQRSEPNEPAGI